MSGDIIRFPGRSSAAAGQGKDQLDVSHLIEEAVQNAQRGHATSADSVSDGLRVSEYIDPEIGLPQTPPDQFKNVVAEILASLVPVMRTDSEIRLRASSSNQGELPPRSYMGLSAGRYVLILFDAITDKQNRDEKFGAYHIPRGLRARVTALGGNVDVSSQPQGQLAVALHLPLDAQTQTLDVSESVIETLEAASLESDAESLAHILLVDDNELAQSSVSSMLKHLGYKVTLRSSGIEALDELRRNPKDYQLVLSDITMPRISGVEMVARLQAQQADTPVILMTGFSVESTVDRTLGVKALLKKPFSLRELERAVTLALDSES